MKLNIQGPGPQRIERERSQLITKSAKSELSDLPDLPDCSDLCMFELSLIKNSAYPLASDLRLRDSSSPMRKSAKSEASSDWLDLSDAWLDVLLCPPLEARLPLAWLWLAFRASPSLVRRRRPHR